ncbi:MAG: amino acid permease [Streptosporangiales bacterium]|nr:amino acid permease [Streptosporangiales bacterium]
MTQASTPDQPAAATTETRLHRGLNLRQLVFICLGNVVGAGIYALVGEMAAQVGGALWIPFMLALVLAVLTVFSYAELSSKYPRAGGASTYVLQAFRSPFLAFMVAFAMVASAINSASTLSLAAGGYVAEIVPVPAVITAVVLVVALGAVTILGVQLSARSNTVLTLVELGGLALVIVAAVAAIAVGTGSAANLTDMDATGGSAPDGGLVAVIFAATSLAFFAFIGFEDAANMAEEAKDPARTCARALTIAVLVAAGVYLTIAILVSVVAGGDRLAGSNAPLLEAVRLSPLGIPDVLFTAIAAIAVGNSVLINLMSSSRLLYGMADQKVLHKVLATVHPTRRTPWIASTVTIAAAAVFVFTGEVTVLATTTVTLLLAIFTLVNVSVLVLRKERVEHKHFKAPTVLPVLGAVVCVVLLTQQEPAVLLRAGVMLLIGVALWLVNHLVVRRRG